MFSVCLGGEGSIPVHVQHLLYTLCVLVCLDLSLAYLPFMLTSLT
jgi:hypothetical protein